MMTLPNITSADFLPLLPAIVLVVGACVLLLSEVYLSATSSRAYQAVLTAGTAVVGGILSVWLMFRAARRRCSSGYAVLDPFSSFMTLIVCVGLGLAALLAAGFLQHRNAERGEFYALMLFAAAGMSLLAISTELITLFVNLEVLSIATYALTSYLRRGPRPSEAGFKYFILGAFSSAVLLYGAALLYGATGTTKLIRDGAARWPPGGRHAERRSCTRRRSWWPRASRSRWRRCPSTCGRRTCTRARPPR